MVESAPLGGLTSTGSTWTTSGVTVVVVEVLAVVGAAIVVVQQSPLVAIVVVVEVMVAMGFSPLPLIEAGWAAMVTPASRCAGYVA